MQKHHTVYAIATSGEQADEIIKNLLLAGFETNDISALFPDKESSHEFSHERHTKAPEGAVAGVAAGGLIGGTLGLLAGIGALAIPGVGPLIAAGPLLGALSAAAAGATVGGVGGAMIGMGIPEFEAKRYENRVEEGNILISVHAVDNGEIARVKDVYESAGAEDIAVTHMNDREEKAER